MYPVSFLHSLKFFLLRHFQRAVQKARQGSRPLLAYIAIAIKRLPWLYQRRQSPCDSNAPLGCGRAPMDFNNIAREEDSAATYSPGEESLPAMSTIVSQLHSQPSPEASSVGDMVPSRTPDAQPVSFVGPNTFPKPTPIAPRRFGRYDRGRRVPYKVDEKKKVAPFSVDLSCRPPICGWIPYSHPEGALYFHHPEKNALTDADLTNEATLTAVSSLAQSLCDRLSSSSRTWPQGHIEIVLDYVESGQHKGSWNYYLVHNQHRSVFWLEEFPANELPDWNSVPGVASDTHIHHVLEAQYWYHCDLFPLERTVTRGLLEKATDIAIHALGDVSTSSFSTIESSVDELQNMLQVITAAERKIDKRAPGTICAISRFMYFRARHRFMHFSGQPTARLARNQAIYIEKSGENDRSYLISLLFLILFGAPEVHLRTLNSLYVDRIVYERGIRKLIRDLNNEWQEFIVFATVLLNANVALLAIQSVDDAGSHGSKTPVQLCSYISIGMSVGSIILGLLLVRQNRTSDIGDDALNAMKFMRDHTREVLAILYSLPYALLMWAMLSFLGAFAALCFDSTDLATRLVIAFVSLAIAAVIIWCICYPASRQLDAQRKLIVPRHRDAWPRSTKPFSTCLITFFGLRRPAAPSSTTNPGV